MENIKEIINEVAKKVISMNYGEIIGHYDLASWLHLESKSPDYYSAISRLQKLLLEHSKYLDNIMKIGYKVTRPDDYAKLAIKQYRQGAKKLNKGKKILDFAPVAEMSDIGRSEYQMIKDRATQLNAHLAGGIVELRLLKKQHPLISLLKERT